MNTKAIEQIAGILFMSRDAAHKAHLATGSYAQHAALNGFYDAVVGLADRLVESAQGKYGLMEIPDMTNQINIREPVAMLEDHLGKINRLATKCEESFLKAIIDDINECYYSTIYKLKYLS